MTQMRKALNQKQQSFDLLYGYCWCSVALIAVCRMIHCIVSATYWTGVGVSCCIVAHTYCFFIYQQPNLYRS